MSTNRSWPGRQRVPGLGNNYVVDVTRGSLRVRRWPQATGNPKSPAVRAMNNWMKSAIELAKFMDPYFVSAGHRAAKGTGLYPRDIVIQAMAGNVAWVQLIDGPTITKRRYFREPVMYQGARVQRINGQSISGTGITYLNWEEPIIDTAGMFNLGSPSRLTVPAGVSRINVKGGARINASSSGTLGLHFRKNGTDELFRSQTQCTATRGGMSETGPINVQPGDYFELGLSATGGGSLQVGTFTWFAADILEAS